MSSKRRVFKNEQERDDYIIDKLIEEHPGWTINQILERKEQVVALQQIVIEALTPIPPKEEEHE